MLYRRFGKTGVEVSLLGFGCMRLPLIDNQPSKIDEEKATQLLHYAIDHGVNYIDTAYPYHEGMSEPFVGRALANGYREKVHIATKLPSWMIQSRQDMDKYLNEQLERLQTKYIDFYLVHGLNNSYWRKLKDLGLFEFLESAKADGRIKHIGFSFHDQLDLFKEIVDAYNWEFCQIQYNFMDEHYQAGTEGLEYAAGKGLGIVIMEPLRGGKLANNIPEAVQAVWDKSNFKRSPAEWALRFVWDRQEVSLLLSGMNSLAQVEENIRIASEVSPQTLTAEERKIIDEAKQIYKTRMKINCTNCKYCLPCPAGVNIPGSFSVYNDAHMYDDIKGAKMSYMIMTRQGGKASACQDCGACSAVCPQQLPISQLLRETARTLED